MTTTDTVSDCLTRIRNGQRARLRKVSILNSKVSKSVIQILKDEGYVLEYKIEDIGGNRSNIIVTLKYHLNEPVIHTIKRVSKPGKRIYRSVNDLRDKFYSGLGVFILSTHKGVMTDHQARKLNCGGEVLCGVF